MKPALPYHRMLVAVAPDLSAEPDHPSLVATAIGSEATIEDKTLIIPLSSPLFPGSEAVIENSNFGPALVATAIGSEEVYTP